MAHHCLECGEILTDETQADPNRPTWCRRCERDDDMAKLEARMVTAIRIGELELAQHYAATLVEIGNAL